MGVRKSQVFVVSARKRAADGGACGQVVQMVVCSHDDAAVHNHLKQVAPDLEVLGCTSLAALEQTAKHARDVLAGIVKDWVLVVDPELLALRAAA